MLPFQLHQTPQQTLNKGQVIELVNYRFTTPRHRFSFTTNLESFLVWACKKQPSSGEDSPVVFPKCQLTACTYLLAVKCWMGAPLLSETNFEMG